MPSNASIRHTGRSGITIVWRRDCAVIPAGIPPRALDDDERAVFDVISKRFVGGVFAAARYKNATGITRVEGEPSKTEGKRLVAPGWLEVYGGDAAGENADGH